MPAIDPKIKKELITTYANQLSRFSKILFHIGLFEIDIKSIPVSSVYNVGSRVRWYHPAAWIFGLIILLFKSIGGLLEGINEVWDSCARYNYTVTCQGKDKK